MFDHIKKSRKGKSFDKISRTGKAADSSVSKPGVANQGAVRFFEGCHAARENKQISTDLGLAPLRRGKYCIM